MPYTRILPLTWDQTRDLLSAGIWDRWQHRHPALGDVKDLERLRTGLATDPGRCDEVVGALLGVCADLKSAGATSSVEGEALLSITGHLLSHVLGQVCTRLRGPAADVDAAVVTALWLALCTGAEADWESPRSSFGWRVWTIAVEDLGGHTRREVRRTVRVLPSGDLADLDEVVSLEGYTTNQGVAPASTAASEAELAELLDLARQDPFIDPEHLDLLVELVTTAVQGTVEASEGDPWHFNHEIDVVARRRGVSGRTLRRHRARAVSCLRDASLSWESAAVVVGPGRSATARQAAGGRVLA